MESIGPRELAADLRGGIVSPGFKIASWIPMLRSRSIRTSPQRPTNTDALHSVRSSRSASWRPVGASAARTPFARDPQTPAWKTTEPKLPEKLRVRSSRRRRQKNANNQEQARCDYQQERIIDNRHEAILCETPQRVKPELCNR
jgi:hypothetical protein